jgi:DNA polymerase III epsilon subunit-like protein
LLQLAFQIRDAKGNCLKDYNAYVIPEAGLTIPEESIAIHGIDMAYILSQENPKPVYEVLQDLFAALKDYNVHTIVAHNLAFDYNVISYELYRYRKNTAEWTALWKEIPGYCTYRQGRRYLESIKHPWISGRLTSYYSHFVEPWETSELCKTATLHHADSDVELCWRVYERLSEIQIQKIPLD